MSAAGIGIAMQDRRLQGELRLALIAVGDNSGIAGPKAIEEWANVSTERAHELIQQLIQLGYIEELSSSYGGSQGTVWLNREMYEASGGASWFGGRSEGARNPGWPIPKARRLAIFERDEWQCHYCGRTDTLTLDHVVPQSAGGGHDDDNLVVCCKSCNSAKGAKSYGDFMAWRSRLDG